MPQGSCRKCNEGEIFNEVYECIACDQNCKTCKLTDLDYCLECMNETLKPFNGVCCSDECSTCLKDNSSACTTCKVYIFFYLLKRNQFLI